MTSSSWADTPRKRRVSHESRSRANLVDEISSSEPEEDVDTSDFSSDDEDASSQAGTSSV